MNSTESAKRPSGKRPKKRKFTGNMHTRCKAVHSVDESLNNSASGKKIRLQDVDSSFIEHDDCFDGYRVFDKTIMFTNIQNFASCKKIQKCWVKEKNISEINRRFVYAMRTIGQGHAAMTTFCGVMDFPPPVAEKSYNNIINKLQLCSKEVAEASMQSVALEEVTLTNSSGIIISGDGTWKTSGYSSRVGVCAVIGDKTGKCIDAEVMSSFCKGCDSWKRRKGSPAYKKWKILQVKECLKNHNGSAGMMETVGMVRIFQRSLSHRSVRYTSYIGDGDSKTFSSITASNPYGEDITVSKIECVGHVQKRMGTRLRKLKQMSSKLSDGKSIGEREGCGRKIVDISTNEAIVIFNDGNQGRLKIMQSLGLTVGQFAHKFVTLVDIKRIQTAEVHFNLRTKELDRPHSNWVVKRPGLINLRGVIFHHNNARPHAVVSTRQELMDLGVERFYPNLPIFLTDYHLFRVALNYSFSQKFFDDHDAVQTAIQDFFDSKQPEFYRRGIQLVPERWQ
ncbi:uncharacterized protein TNCV_4473641 [Trichonephila clavipes]|nr:uncharacterized protein TNCV_4473641 [Trichonephila clavipes]